MRGVAARGSVPAAGAHGGDGARIAASFGFEPSTVIDLSASLNPFAPDVQELAVHELCRRGSAALAAYPDATDATARIAAAIGVDAERLVLTNGGSEAIALVAGELGTGSVVEPEFSLYRRHLRVVDAAAPRWRSNPSNPLGVLAAMGESAGVWDEAFFPLATGCWTRGDEGSWRLGSLTKLWSCPGLRLGYVIAPDVEAARRIRASQPRWSVNGLALALVPALLERTELTAWQRGIADLGASLAAALGARGFDVTCTAANWLLVDRPGLRADLAPLGLAVRDCTSFGMPGVHRVALPRPEQLDRVIAAFAAVA